jgi:pyridoxamine 5'-phosphate oxidase
VTTRSWLAPRRAGFAQPHSAPIVSAVPETHATDRLPEMRRAYDPTDGLSEDDLAPTWLEQFERWLDDVVDSQRLVEPNAMILATADAQCRPSARTVLLKGVDERGFVFYTNLESRKGRDALANPNAALVFDWIELQRQVTVTGALEPLTGAESDAYFASRPRGSQIGAHASHQSRPIGSREELDDACRAASERYPGEVPRPPHWGGLRVVPDTVEFWHGRPNRLHDRLRYRRAGGGEWVVERLAP